MLTSSEAADYAMRCLPSAGPRVDGTEGVTVLASGGRSTFPVEVHALALERFTEPAGYLDDFTAARFWSASSQPRVTCWLVPLTWPQRRARPGSGLLTRSEGRSFDYSLRCMAALCKHRNNSRNSSSKWCQTGWVHYARCKAPTSIRRHSAESDVGDRHHSWAPARPPGHR
jgi:hypothetical protein